MEIVLGGTGNLGRSTVTGWTAADVPDQRGRTIIVTGATSGLGAAATRILARSGAHVVMACRDLGRAHAVAATLEGGVEVRHLDLTDLESVRSFAASLDGEVDVLVNNAGVMAVPYGVTKDGFELHLGVNHLGPFLLTGLLLDRITGRVVTVSSGLHRLASGEVLRPEPGRYRRWSAYGRSKLANLLFAYELERRLGACAHPASSVAAHPGVAATEGQRRDTSVQGKLLAGGRAQPVAMGVLPILYAATEPGVAGGSCVGPDGFAQRHGHPALVRTSRGSYDRDRAARVWQQSERLTGFSYSWARQQS